MDKRSWLWKKRATERSGSSQESVESCSYQSLSQQTDYQVFSGNIPDHPQSIDDGASTWQDYEERMKVLNDKLSAALMDAASKEQLARQHVLLAEEAVSGWETMEAEATMMKQQLEAAIQQKLAAEDRVSHLDDALKECMWQLRSVREDQEDNIHKAVMKKAQEWDKLRFELEEKMADLEHKFLEKDAENRVLSKSLSERSRTISQMSDALTKAQAEASMLQVRLESSEKEKAALKYELSVAHKEVEIRNEEKALSKRAADVACKQHLEDVKKMAKLDAECQRLRNLVRKKLPGPGAVALMKLEIEGSGTEKTDARRKCVKSNVSSKDSVWQSMQGPQSEDQNEGKQKGSLSDQYNSLEEEIKILREILTQRNSELQSARLMCARTASKLSAVEEQLEALNSSQGKQRMPAFSLDTQVERSLSDSGEPSVTSVSETGNDDEVNCAESWATALIAELDQFKKGKLMPMSSSIGLEPKLGTGCLSEVEQLLSSNSSEENYSMRNNAVETCLSSSPPIKSDSKQHIFWHQKEDPLAEDRTKKNENVDQNENENEDRRMRNNAVETCLSSSPPIKSDSKQHIFWHQKEDPLAEDRTKKNENVDQNLTKESEVQNTCKLCREFQIKLDTVEGELVKKAADQRSLEKLKQKLMFMFEEGYLSNEIFDQIREDIGFGGDSHRNSSLDSSLSVLQNVDHLCMQDVTCPFLIVDSSFHRPVSELAAAIGKLVPLMKDFARDSNNENQSSARARELATDTNTVNLGTQIFDKTQRMIDALNDKSEKLMMMSDRFIKSEIDISKIMMAVSEITSDFCRIRLSEFNVSRPSGRKAPSYRTSTTASGDLDYFAVGSPISDTSKSEFSDAAARIVPTDESTQFTRKDCLLSEIIIPQEFGKSETERVTLDTQVRTEYRRFYEVLEELEHLKLVKQELETSADKERKEIDELKTEICELQQMIEGLKVENKEIQELRREICEAEQRLAGIQAQLTSVEFSKQLGEKQINDLALAKEELESRLAAYERESGNLRDELDALRKELLGKEQKNLELVAESKEMEARVKELLLNEERNLELEKECKELQEKLEQSKCQRCSISSKKEDELCRELEIVAASQKLAECERTILMLGQQLKALASPKGSPYRTIQNSQGSYQSQSPLYLDSSSRHTMSSKQSLITPEDDTWAFGSSARFSEPRDFKSSTPSQIAINDCPWDPQKSIASDILDSELISLSMAGPASGRKIFEMFGGRMPVHEDYIEAVAQMPSSPETEAISPKKIVSKPPIRKKKPPRSFAKVDMTKSMNDAPSTEKQSSSFSKFFSKTKSNR